MASVTPDKLSKAEKDELCVSYAALMLHDDGLDITVSQSTTVSHPYHPSILTNIGREIVKNYQGFRKRG